MKPLQPKLIDTKVPITEITIMRSCLNCVFFKSFASDYFDDMEPDDQGFCENGESIYFGNEGAGYGVVCEFHSLKQNEN
jgi:hypothetical protein